MKFAVFFYVVLLLGLNEGCKKKKTEDPPKKVPPPSGDTKNPGGDDSTRGDGEGKGEGERKGEGEGEGEGGGQDAPLDPRADEEARALWSKEVIGKSWKICRKYSATDSALVTIVLKQDTKFERTEELFDSDNCKDKPRAENPKPQSGFVVDLKPVSPDSWTTTVNYEGNKKVFQRMHLKDGKLFFCDYDAVNDGGTPEKRCKDVDMNEPHVSGDKPEIVAAKR